ncbi:MAG: bifunctional riboflavin kinase/FAD synthetase [Hyphomicrobiales bacterium]|nr:bifunctional riboflavin kinase/FAD synthetase [Hyphomicrobiales bacterium]
MEILHGWRNTPERMRGGAIAIGNFDGVHRGHQEVLAQARAFALALGKPSGAMIFEPHPRAYFQPGQPMFRLTPLEAKLALLAEQGLDFTAVIPFERTLAEMPAEDFARTVLADGFSPRRVVVGYDFFFGKGRGGNAASLTEMGVGLGFSVHTAAPVGGEGEIFSSTRIRELLAEGDVRGASAMLGRNWRARGEVKRGAGRGTGLGFPTANIDLEPGQALRHGIYAVFVHVDGATHQGAAYLGPRPTFDDGAPVLEVFLLDFSGDLYGRPMEVEFVAFIRGDGKFKSAEALSAQMERDCAAARAILLDHRRG